ncbi:pyrroline-5-carboxylate reductase [Rhodobacterales bacterium HKCCE3408]|nr:pyrroline-5-carboxylate reductase [Rhodobacterales bacterium HKCCE3408]
MEFSELDRRGLVILGCGKMGSAMLAGWLARGLSPDAVTVLEPHPSDWLKSTGVRIGGELPEAPGALVVAVKPQVMDAALPSAASLGGGGTLVVSVAAGTTLDRLGASFGPATPIVRAMPNTPAAIGRGISAIIGNDAVDAGHLDLAEALLSAVGQVVRLETEDQIDAVTGLSGSGPAYVFHMIEAMTAAGVAEGLPADMATELAVATVAGAGALALESGETAEQLRINVTSPNGTTQAGLEVLMDEGSGLKPLIARTVAAAAARSRELKG